MRPVTADESYELLLAASDELRAWSYSDVNEADTRAKIIDRFFMGVLGWDESQVRREVRTEDGDYLDYHFESSSNRLIVEAKSVGQYFEMPAGKRRRARRGGIISSSRSLHAALKQLVGYCASQSVPAGVACNGLQLAVTLPYIPAGVTCDTVLFDGIEQVLADFTQIWNLLSPSGDCERYLREIALAPEYLRAPPAFSRRVLDEFLLPDATMARNPIDSALAPTLLHYFSDLTGPGRREVLQHAYIETDRQAQYGKQLDAVLADAAPQLNVDVTSIATTKTSARPMDVGLAESLEQTTSDGSLLLLVGGVGAGKTTFVNRYFSFLVSPELSKRILPIYLDFTHTTEDTSNLSNYVDPEVLRQLEDAHPEYKLDEWETSLRVYEREVSKLRRGDLAPYWANNRQRFDELVADAIRAYRTDTAEHVRRLLIYLKLHHQMAVCVIFDNVDQFSQEFQHRAIRLAFQKTKTWGCVGILALREETYWRFRNSPPLDAYHRNAFHVSAPRVANVLAARLDLAKKQEGEERLSIASGTGIQFSAISKGQFLEILIDSFLGENQRNIVLLEALCANDVRQALDMFARFLLSGHTNTDEYIKAYANSGRYLVPIHHLLRGIAFAERRNYDSSKSLIGNIFSLTDDGYYSHFQQIRLLRHLQSMRQLDSAPGRGFVTIEQLFGLFRGLMVDGDGLRRVLDPLLRHRLIEAANGYRVHGDAADAVRMTASGDYYLSNLIYKFEYLELAATDTVIKSQPWFARIRAEAVRNGWPIDDFYARFEKVSLFIDYLEEDESAELEYVGSLGLPDVIAAPIVPAIRERFGKRREAIRKRAQRWGTDRRR